MFSEERQLGRAKNVLLSFFERKLSVPKIYIDAEWSGEHLDLLGIDRDGVGDVHAVLLFKRTSPPVDENTVKQLTSDLELLVQRFKSVPAQYKYICAVDVAQQGGDVLPGIPHPIVDQSFSPDGIGRIGFLAVDFPPNGEPQARVVSKPERFRARVAELADEYVEKHTADWEIRA